MKIPAKHGLVMALTLGLVLMTTPMALCYSICGIEVNLSNPFKSKPSKNHDVALSPSLAPAPAPGPSMMTSSSRQSGPFSTSSVPSTPGLAVGFYKDKCNSDVEDIIEVLVSEEFDKDPTILPALLRLQFHDCFVHGCDASLLVNGESTEKTAGSNLSVRGYELIERLKAAIEEECPGVVSCADIVVVATKVVIKLGGGLDFPVETGRRDGLVSNAADVDLPSPSMTVAESAAVFAAKNFSLEEMVVLLGYHAVGITHCQFIQDRLYDGTSQFDPEMDSNLRLRLREVCPQGPPMDNPILLNQDPTNNNTLNNGFYGQLMGNRGILHLDQALSRDPTSANIVAELAQNNTLFNIRTAQVMIKLQAVDVLTGNQGEIRKVCGSFN